MELNKQSVVITPAVAEVREDRYTLTLTREEIEFLTVLVDFPLHYEQGEKPQKMLYAFANMLSRIQHDLDYLRPNDYGFTKSLNLGFYGDDE